MQNVSTIRRTQHSQHYRSGVLNSEPFAEKQQQQKQQQQQKPFENDNDWKKAKEN